MFRKYLTTSLVALSIAAAPVSAPTAMAKDNLDKFLIGLTAIGILGAIAHESNKNRSHTTVTTHPKPNHNYNHNHNTTYAERHRHGNVVHTHAHKHGHHHGGHVQVSKPKHVHVRPKHCLRQKWTRNGWVKFYSQSCLNSHRGYKH